MSHKLNLLQINSNQFKFQTHQKSNSSDNQQADKSVAISARHSVYTFLHKVVKFKVHSLSITQRRSGGNIQNKQPNQLFLEPPLLPKKRRQYIHGELKRKLF